VIHHGVSYEKPASRIRYEIKNESSPPLTQVGERTFEVHLQAEAKISSVLAAGPGNIGVMIFPALVPGEPGHYTVNFPLRPGETKFAFNYNLLYEGHAAFQTRHAYALQQLAVMIPTTMNFSSRFTLTGLRDPCNRWTRRVSSTIIQPRRKETKGR
jgi:hypothetical protein